MPTVNASPGLPRDDLFYRQWYLNNTGQSFGVPGVDLNVLDVWKDYTGAGVTVGVYDDGVQYDHPDLDGNYDTSLHIVIDGQVHDPYPEGPQSVHGTPVAGIIAAERNGKGTVGVAYGAKIAGVDIFFDPALGGGDFSVTGSLAFHEMDRFDITNHSWASAPYEDNQFSLRDDIVSFYAGWQESVQLGRDGLGTVNVVSAGNSRLDLEHTNMSNRTSSPYAIAVAAVTHDGEVALYSSPGASLLISGLSNVVVGPPEGDIWTTDRTGKGGYSDGKNQAPLNNNPNYDAFFGGTSAAAPTVSGVVALILDANPLLGYRDVQQILAYSARHVGSPIGSQPLGSEKYAWGFNAADTWNGGGLHFSNDYGFGLVDALAAVRLAETWTGQETFANLQLIKTDVWHGDKAIPYAKALTFTIATGADVSLESVELGLNHSGDLTDYDIVLTSPSGTKSILSTATPFFDVPSDAKIPWAYYSNAFRGEDAAGVWKISITDAFVANPGRLTDAYLRFYGAAPSDDDVLIFTNEFSDYAGRNGHSKVLGDTAGRDTLNAAAVSAATTIDLAKGTGVIDGVKITLRGSVQDVLGGDGDDKLTGDARANWLAGGRGADTLKGGGGKDVIEDGDGRDVMYGGNQGDLFRLGLDRDVDRIKDFELGRDWIELTCPANFDFDDLNLRTLKKGEVQISFLDECLIITGGRTLTAAALTDHDILIV